MIKRQKLNFDEKQKICFNSRAKQVDQSHITRLEASPWIIQCRNFWKWREKNRRAPRVIATKESCSKLWNIERQCSSWKTSSKQHYSVSYRVHSYRTEREWRFYFCNFASKTYLYNIMYVESDERKIQNINQSIYKWVLILPKYCK